MLRSRLSQQNGFSIVEVMFASMILAIGMFSTVKVYAGSHSGTLVAQRQEVATHKAQEEIENLRTYRYADLLLNSAAADAGDTAHALTSGSPQRLLISPGIDEPVAVSTDPGVGVEPSETFSVTADGTTMTGTIYRYVTWRDEPCPASLDPCYSDTTDTKRITVAVTLDAVNSKPALAPTRPIWLSSVVVDRNARPAGKTAPPPDPSNQTGKNLFLYNKPCGTVGSSSDSYSELPTGDVNPTHNTFSYGTSTSADAPTAASGPSYCESATGATDPLTGRTEHPISRNRPDLMGTAPPPAGGPAMPFNYSADTLSTAPSSLLLDRTDSVTGGLLMTQHNNASCAPNPRYLGSDDAVRNTGSNANRWNTHAWSSRAPQSEVHLRSKAVFDFHAIGRSGTTGTGRLCLSLIRREFSPSSGGAFKDVTISANAGSCAINVVDNTNFHNFRCTIQMSTATALQTAGIKSADSDGTPYWRIPASNYRLMVVASVPSNSDMDLILAYDHPDYNSLLQVTCDPDACDLEQG